MREPRALISDSRAFRQCAFHITAMPPGLERRSKLPGARPRALARSFSWRKAWPWKARFAALSYETGFRKSKLEDVLGMIGTPRADDGRARRRALFHPRLAHSPGHTLTLRTNPSSRH